MAPRRLSRDEAALWDALVQSVRPLRPARRAAAAPVASPPPPEDVKARTDGIPASWLITPPPATAPRRSTPGPVATLDTSWERRIRSGTLSPDMSIDLHGHSLSAAHARLNRTLADAIAADARILLVVTGKPRPTGSAMDQRTRGAIRAEIGHWLESSPHADRIASVRVAHPRHGGDGAIYLILRRKKDGR